MQKVQDCVAFLRTILHAAVSRKGHIAVWISSPCTAGSKMKFLNLFKRWRERYKDHVTIWKAIRKLELGKVLNIKVGREWPVGCDLKVDLPYVRCAKEIGLVYTARIHRCCLDGMRKEWEIACNCEVLASKLDTGPCMCAGREAAPTLKKSGEYSREVALHVVRAFQRTLS